VTSHLTFLFLGLGAGAVIAALGLGIVITHRASGIINFAHASIGAFIALGYYEFRATGDLVLPVLGLPDRVHLLDRPTTATALVVVLLYAVLIGIVLYWLIFRTLRGASPLAGLAASLGLMLYFITLGGLRFDNLGATALVIEGPLPDDLVTIGGVVAPADRYWLAAIVIAAALVLWAGYRFTRLGLSTRAVAEDHVAASLLGISPHPVGMWNWAIATVFAGGALILAAPIIRLDPTTSSLLIIPALAAALPGRFDRLGLTVAFGLGIGMLQSEILNLQTDWTWLPDVGLQQGIPFLVILVTLLVRGDVLPGRAAATEPHLPAPVDHKCSIQVFVAVGVFSVLAFSSSTGRGVSV